MNHYLFHRLLAPTAALILCVSAHADDTVSAIKFSDASKPGTVKINLGRGELRIEGSDTQEITVRSDLRSSATKPRKDGLRELAASSSFSLQEKDNVVTLDASANDWGKGNSNFRLSVPRSTTVIVQNTWGGNVACSGLSGDIEINSMQGEIKLDDVAGGVVVSTMNGEIRASIRELREGKPVSFTSMNGQVQLNLPEVTKANVRLRTQNGSVLTDFDESSLVTKSETTAGSRGRSAFTFKDSKVLTVEIQEAIREATAMSATAVREALEAVKQGLDEARLNSDEARLEVDVARRQMELARREADRARAAANRERRGMDRAGEAPPAPPAPAVAGGPGRAPTPPKVPIPTISGGKLVTGTLNGGGPEISVATMNGDVVLRKAAAK